MNADDVKERRIAWAIIVISMLSMAFMFIYVTSGMAPGLDSGHPMIYLQLTVFLWAVIMLIVPILRLLSMVSLPLWFIVILYADMYMYVISLCQGMYLDIYWWANVTHVASTMVVTAIVFLALCKMTSHCPPHVNLGSKGGIVVMMFFIGMAFGAIWETSEGLTDLLSGYDYMIYGAVDNVGNLAADLVGALLMVPVALLVFSKYEVSEIASTVRIGRKNIDVG